MEFTDVIRQRRSVRAFLPKPVSDNDIETIVWSAGQAPTARNVQPWEFIVIKNTETRQEVSRLASPNGDFIKDSPVCIAVFSKDCKYYLEDCSAAVTQALLCAASLGLGACWVAGDKKDYCAKVGRLLRVPDGYRLVSLIAIGYSSENPTPKKRDLKDIIHRERF